MAWPFSLPIALLFGIIATAYGASSLNSLPAVGSNGSSFPLPDPGAVTQNLWISQGSGSVQDFRITPTQLGYIYQGASAPLNPFRYQLWWNTAANPAPLQVYTGTAWATIGSLDYVNNVWTTPSSKSGIGTLVAATTTDLGSIPDTIITVTGTANIQSFGTSASLGTIETLLFSGSPTLVYNSSTMKLPTGANITVPSGTVGVFVALGGGSWQMVGMTSLPVGLPIADGTNNDILYQANNALAQIPTLDDGVLVTNASGVPSIATTLPSGITIPGATITGSTLNSPTINTPTIAGGTMTTTTITGVTISSSSIAAGTLSAQSVSGNVAPHVPTLAALQSSCVSSTGCPGTDPVFTNGTWRDDYATGNGAAPLFYLGETGTCSANSRINDGGSCVNTTSGDGNSFYAVWPNGNIDVREFGAIPNDSTDDTAAVNAAIAYVETTSAYFNALNSAQTARACVYFPSNPVAYRFLSTPNMAQDGLCVRGDGKTVSVLHFIDVSGLQVKSNSDFSDLALIGTAPTSSVSTATYGLWTDGSTYYEQPILRNIRISGFVQCEHFPGGFDNAKVDYVDCDDHNYLYPNLTNEFPGPGIWLSEGGSYAPAGNRWIGGEVRRQAFQQSQSYTGDGSTTNFNLTLTVSGKNYFLWAADGIVVYNLNTASGQTEWSVGTVGGQARCGSDRDYTIWDITGTATQLGCHYLPSVSFTAGSPNATITTGYTDIPTGSTSLADSIDLPPNTTVVSYNSSNGALVLSQNAQRSGTYPVTLTQVAVSGTNSTAACQVSVTCGHVLQVRFNSAPANNNTVVVKWVDPWAFASIYDEGGSDNHFIDINQVSGDRRLFVHGGQGSAYGGDIFAPDYVEITHTCASVLNVGVGPTGSRPQGDRVTIQHALLPAFQCPGSIDSTAGEVYVDFNQHVSTYNFAGEQEFSYTPTITCGSGAVGAYTTQFGLYGISGHRVTIYSIGVHAAVGTCSGVIKISLPVTPAFQGTLTAFDNSTSPYILGSFIGAGGAFIEVFNSTGANPSGGDAFILSGSYAQ